MTELPGMWEEADLSGGWADSEQTPRVIGADEVRVGQRVLWYRGLIRTEVDVTPEVAEELHGYRGCKVTLLSDAPTEDSRPSILPRDVEAEWSSAEDSLYDEDHDPWGIEQDKASMRYVAMQQTSELEKHAKALSAKLERVQMVCEHAKQTWPGKPTWITVGAIEMAMADDEETTDGE